MYMNNNVKAYNLAQRAISDLKTAVHLVLSNSDEPLTNAGVGTKLIQPKSLEKNTSFTS
jgi:hypothetical protein